MTTKTFIPCPACDGEGTVPVRGRHEECRPCEGTGAMDLLDRTPPEIEPHLNLGEN